MDLVSLVQVSHTLKLYNAHLVCWEMMSINNLPRFIINQNIDIFMVFAAVQCAVIFVTVL